MESEVILLDSSSDESGDEAPPPLMINSSFSLLVMAEEMQKRKQGGNTKVDAYSTRDVQNTVVIVEDKKKGEMVKAPFPDVVPRNDEKNVEEDDDIKFVTEIPSPHLKLVNGKPLVPVSSKTDTSVGRFQSKENLGRELLSGQKPKPKKRQFGILVNGAGKEAERLAAKTKASLVNGVRLSDINVSPAIKNISKGVGLNDKDVSQANKTGPNGVRVKDNQVSQAKIKAASNGVRLKVNNVTQIVRPGSSWVRLNDIDISQPVETVSNEFQLEDNDVSNAMKTVPARENEVGPNSVNVTNFYGNKKTEEKSKTPSPKNKSSSKNQESQFAMHFKQFVELNSTISSAPKDSTRDNDTNEAINNGPLSPSLKKTSEDPLAVSPDEPKRSRCGRIIKRKYDSFNSETDEEKTVSLPPAKKPKCYLKPQVAKKRAKPQVEKMLYVSDSQKDFLSALPFIQRNGNLYVPVSLFTNVYSNFSIDLVKLEALLNQMYPDLTPNYLFNNFSISHVSIQAAKEIMKCMKRKPRFIYNFISKMSLQTVKILVEDFAPDNPIETEEPEAESPKYDSSPTLTDLGPQAFGEVFGLCSHDRANEIREQSRKDRERQLRKSKRSIKPTPEQKPEEQKPLKLPVPKPMVQQGSSMPFCSGIVKPFFRLLTRPIWNKKVTLPNVTMIKQTLKMRRMGVVLPPGWQLRVKNIKSAHYRYISPCGIIFRNLERAMKFWMNVEKKGTSNQKDSGKQKKAPKGTNANVEKQKKNDSITSSTPKEEGSKRPLGLSKVKAFRKFPINTPLPHGNTSTPNASQTSESAKLLSAKKKKRKANTYFNLAAFKTSLPDHHAEGWFTAKIDLLRHLSQPLEKGKSEDKSCNKSNEALVKKRNGPCEVQYSEGVAEMLDLPEWKMYLAESALVTVPPDQDEIREIETKSEVYKRIENQSRVGVTCQLGTNSLPYGILKKTDGEGTTVFVNVKTGESFPNLLSALNSVDKVDRLQEVRKYFHIEDQVTSGPEDDEDDEN